MPIIGGIIASVLVAVLTHYLIKKIDKWMEDRK